MGKKFEKVKELVRNAVGGEQPKQVAAGMSDPVLPSDQPAPAKAVRPNNDSEPAAGTSAAEAGLVPAQPNQQPQEVKPEQPASSGVDANAGKENA